MNKFILLLSLFFSGMGFSIQAEQNYWNYHQEVIKAESFIANEEYAQALEVFEALFADYDFVFVREYKVATQVAAYIGKTDAAFNYMEKGIAGGWRWKHIRKLKVLDNLKGLPKWKALKQAYQTIRAPLKEKYASSFAQTARKMSAKDQKMAFKALFRIGDKAQTRYCERKFAPHSEKQIAKLNQLLNQYGYPGERLVGNGHWISTIIGHHNSISPPYAQQDTLYPQLKPQLMTAIEKGELSPYEFALIDDWYIAVKSDRKIPGYGYLNKLPEDYVPEANALRKAAGMRPITLRNQLVGIQTKTGMKFYLWTESWLKGEIIPYK